MRWTNNRIDPHSIIKDKALINRTLLFNRSKMDAAGFPCTYYKNMTFNPDGTIRPGLTKCYCWSGQEAQPDRKHALCMGTGYLEGYQKYGYNETVISTPSTLTKTSGIVITSGTKTNDRFVMSSTNLVETITTQQIPLDRFYDVTYFYATGKNDPTSNRIRFYYTTNDTTWVEIPMEVYNSDISTHRALVTFNWGLLTASWVRFRFSLEKRYTTSASPELNSIRFKYRDMPNYGDIDLRFSDVRIPAFLAAREQAKQIIEATNVGFKTGMPMQWWTLPEVQIEENDVIRFLWGDNMGQTHIVNDLTKFQYGPKLQVLHRSFSTKYIREYNDLLGIVHLLN